MNIGTIKENASGQLIGSIATLAVSMTVALRPVDNPNPKAPKYDIMALSTGKAWVKVGALFELFSNSTGEAFLNGPIDDPSMAAPIQVSAFQQKDGSYNVVWSRQKRRVAVPETDTGKADDAVPLLAPECDDASLRPDDGLGESTAPAFSVG